ncbi:PAS domain-containing serine/threonine-protein kinase-like isoform X1, partial [Clarias magur]
NIMDMATTSADYSNRANEHLAFSFLTEEVTSRYAIGALLGRGGFGAVFAGVRIADSREVAVKVFKKDPYFGMMTMPGETGVLPIEVGLMELVSKPFGSPYVLELLEWFEIPNFIVLILERPSPCVDLADFCEHYNGKLPEALARDIMLQLVQAAYHCYNCGVFHNDIKPGNVLINTETMQIKLFDFGSGKLLKDEPYNCCTSTPVYSPPEYFKHNQYRGCPATIWSLGLVLYILVCGDIPFKSWEEMIQGYLHFPPGISKDCCKLISWCLKQNPKSRPSFRQILRHRWFRAGQCRVQ